MTLDLDERRVRMLEEMGIRGFDVLRSRAGVDVAEHVTADDGADAGARVDAHVDADVDADVPTALAAPLAPLAPLAPFSRAVPAPVPAGPGAPRPPTPLDSLGWDELERAAAECAACALSQGRRGAILGAGDRQADWLVVGEPPSELEDLQGGPFAGESGVLLDNMLRAVGRSRQRGAYLASIVKCRPPSNRAPTAQELAQCEPFIARQVALLKPRVILALGRHAAQVLLRSDEPPGRLRGRIHEYRGTPVVVSFHPDYLRRNRRDKALAWADLCLAQSISN